MKYFITLQDIRDGYQKRYYAEYEWEDEADMFYMWFEGNYACDCNRSLFLYNGDETQELACNIYDDDNVIKIVKIEDETGKQIYERKLNG